MHIYPRIVILQFTLGSFSLDMSTLGSSGFSILSNALLISPPANLGSAPGIQGLLALRCKMSDIVKALGTLGKTLTDLLQFGEELSDFKINVRGP